MAITISPNTNVTAVTGLPVCFEASAIYSLPQEDARCIDLPSSGTNWTFDALTCLWKRVSGTNGIPDAPVYQANVVYGLQPFYIEGMNITFSTPASPQRFYGAFIGATHNNGNFYGWYIYKNCGSQSPANCNATTSGNDAQNWKAFVYSNQVIVNPIPVGVNASEIFRLRSNGISLTWERKTGGVWQTVHTESLPTVDNWTFHLNSLFNNNELWYVNTFRGSFQGQVPTIWTTPDGGTLTGSGNNRCFTHGTPGTYSVCVASEFESAVCVPIEVDDLYFIPADFDCGQCVFAGETVQFESNGGLAGDLAATHGTVIDSLTWQAPTFPVEATLTYSIDEYSAECIVNVVEPFRALNVEGNELRGLLPGDTFQILTNYDPPNGEVIWQNVSCPGIVTPDGIIRIPRPNITNCFGALDCTIRAVLVGIDGDTCDNLISGEIGSENYRYIDFRIIVDPVFPTPDMGGPQYLKFVRRTPDFRVLVNTFEGGCDETYLRNEVPVYKWEVQYAGLFNDTECPQELECQSEVGYVGGYGPYYQSVARLDEFWNLVYGRYGHFTLIEPRTGTVWRNVRFDTEMEVDHINWRTNNSRNMTLIWSPCCAETPKGGVCRHTSTVIPPSEPLNLTAEAMNSSIILWSWDEPIL